MPAPKNQAPPVCNLQLATWLLPGCLLPKDFSSGLYKNALFYDWFCTNDKLFFTVFNLQAASSR